MGCAADGFAAGVTFVATGTTALDICPVLADAAVAAGCAACTAGVEWVEQARVIISAADAPSRSNVRPRRMDDVVGVVCGFIEHLQVHRWKCTGGATAGAVDGRRLTRAELRDK